VDQSTVSRALRNRPEVPAETREKIQSLAEEMGYTPDPLLAGLAAYRVSRKPSSYHATLGLISDHKDLDGWRRGLNLNGVRFYEGILERGKQLGYSIEEFSPAHMKVDATQLSKVLYARGIRGLIIAPRKQSKSHLNLDWNKFSAVALGHSLFYPRLHRIAHDHFQSTVFIMRRLKQLGYRRIGFVIPRDLDERNNHGWLAGFLVEGRRISTQTELPWFCPENPMRNAHALFKIWFKKHQPDVLVGVNHLVTSSWLTEMKIRVPKDVGFAHLNLRHRDDGISGFYEKSHTIGQTAVDVLVSMMQRNETGVPDAPKITLVEGEWIEGETVNAQAKR
jgi:LacI family transcriptional regulator